MATTADQVMVNMQIRNQQYLLGMGQSANAAEKVQKQLDVLRSTMGQPVPAPKMDALIGAMDQGAEAAKKFSRNMQFNTSNIVAQFNDIGVTAAMGMSPLMIALQQGTQLTQAFAGQKLSVVVSGIGDAFKSLVSPTTLVTLALVAGASALIQWAMSAGSAEEKAKKTKDILDELDKSLDAVSRHLEILNNSSLDEVFGNMTPEVREITQALLALDRAAELKTLQETLKKIKAEALDPSFFDQIKAGFTMENFNINPTGDFFADKKASSDRFQNRIQEGKYNELTKGKGLPFADFNKDTGLIEQAAKAGKIEEVMTRVNQLFRDMASGGPITDMNTEMQTMLGQIGDAAISTAKVEAQFNGTAIAAEKANKEAEKLAEAVTKSAKATDEETISAQQKLKIAEAEFKYGESSMQAATARREVEREILEAKLAQAGVNDADIGKIADMIDKTNMLATATQVWASITSGLAEARDRLVKQTDKIAETTNSEMTAAQQKLELAQMAAQYGEDSTRYAEEKAAIDRENLETALRAKDVTEENISAIIAVVSETDNVIAATAEWESRMASVKSIIAGIMADIASIGGGLIQNASTAVEIKALRAGKTRAEAAREAQRFNNQMTYEQSNIGANPVQKGVNWLRNQVAERRVVLSEELQFERDAAAERERIAAKAARGSKGSRGGKTDAEKDYNKLIKERDSLLREIMTPTEQYAEELEKIQELLSRDLITEDQASTAKKRLEALQPVAMEVAGALRNAFTSAFDDGSSALKNLGKQLLMLALQMQLAKSFPSVFGAGGMIDLGYDTGGYTGPGGVKQPAGVVHKGEVVWSQQDVRRAGGVGVVEAMRRGQAGYSGGGAPAAYGGAVSSSGGRGTSVNIIDQRGSGAPPIETNRSTGPSGDEMIEVIVSEQITKGKHDKAMRGRYSAQPTRMMR